MRARILTAGLLVLAAACSRPATDNAVESDVDARDADPDLALTPRLDAVPIASDVEMHQQQTEASHEHGTPAAAHDERIARPEPEPLAGERTGDLDASPAVAAAPVPAPTYDVHPKAPDPQHATHLEDELAASDGDDGQGGKPTDVSTGLGPVPDRNWGDPAIIDDPDPIEGVIPGVGRPGAVIIRGGAGGIDDDCALHRPGTVATVPASGPGALVNDRDPRRGALINERAPRSTQRPSLPRGGGFPRGGIR